MQASAVLQLPKLWSRHNVSKTQLAASVPGRTALRSALVTYQKNALRAKAPTRLSTNLADFENKKYSALCQHERRPQVDTP